MSTTVYVSLGSNVERDSNIRLAIKEMRADFGELLLSPVYESASVGFDGSDRYAFYLIILKSIK